MQPGAGMFRGSIRGLWRSVSHRKKLRGLTAPGKYTDGRGLFLHVVTAERRNWLLRYMRTGKEHVMGLGSATVVSLDEAREKAQAARKLLAAGVDPIDARQAEQAAAQAEQAKRITFAEAATQYIAAQEAGWRNATHKQQWRNTLGTYAEPILGVIPMGEIDSNMVLRTLAPIWHSKPETASRVRSRIEMVLDYAAARGWRTGTNPAIGRGNLKLMLPAKTKVRAVKHHAALDWREAPLSMTQLRARDGMGAKALELAILTAARSGEVREAPATRAAYASDWKDFAVWCLARGAASLSTHQGIVAAYLSSLADSGRKASTIGRRAAAIADRHRRAGYEPPTNNEGVKATLRGIRRTIGAARRGKEPIVAEMLMQMLKHCPDTLAGKRDAALLSLCFAGRSGAARCARLTSTT
jgi:hypothetical protein